MIIYNGVVHPMDGPVIPRGYVAFEGDKITAVGPMEELEHEPEGLDAQGGQDLGTLYCVREIVAGEV